MDASKRQALPRAAVIGAGFMGSRIAAELLLLGVEVSVYEKLLEGSGSRGQRQLEQKVYPGEGNCKLNWCSTIADAVRKAHIVIECVHDDVRIKASVLAEAWVHAPPGALLATNTIRISVSEVRTGLQTVLNQSGIQDKCTQAPRLVGLRFLFPVLFVPFVEATLTKQQMDGADHRELMEILSSWSKSAIISTNAVGTAMRGDDSVESRRLLLNKRFAFDRQQAEARLRGGSATQSETCVPGALYSEEKCCICLDSAATVTSLYCGHCALCEDCASIVESQKKQGRCPLCRVPFQRLNFVSRVFFPKEARSPSLRSCECNECDSMMSTRRSSVLSEASIDSIASDDTKNVKQRRSSRIVSM